MSNSLSATPAPRPVSVTVVPLLLAILALANVLLCAAMLVTGELPDPLVVFATATLGWHPVPLVVFFVAGALVVAAAFLGWYVGVRRLSTHPGRFGLSRALTVAIPAIIGLVMPSVWWQVGQRSTPEMIRGSDSATHIVLAVAAIVLPTGLVAWRWWRARNTLGAAQATGVAAAPRVTEIAPSEVARTFTAVTTRMTASLAREISERIVEGLRFHSAYLPEDVVYQFLLPNGAYLTLADDVSAQRRTLTVSMHSPHRRVRLFRGLIVRPRSQSPHGGWFAVPDPRLERRVVQSLANNVQQAFAAQDDVPFDGAVVVDPAKPFTRIS